MGGFADRLRQWWDRTDRMQRLVTLGGMGMVCLLLGACFMFLSRPRYEVLFSHLSEQEQGMVASDLEGMGFHPNADKMGTVEIPAEEKAAARMKLAAANKLPKASGEWGIDQLNTSPLGSTPSVELERIKAINEGEIAKSIESMDGVESARVQLTLGTHSPFAEEQRPASASVSIVEGANSTLNSSQGRAIAGLVKNSVDGLDEKDIVVVNQHLQTIFNGAEDADGESGGAQKKTEMDQLVSKQRERELQGLLDGAFGAGAAIVTVHADVDMDPVKTESDTQTPTGVISQETASETVSGGGAKGVGGLTGVNANTTSAPGAGTTGPSGGGYKGNTATKENALSETKTQTSKAIGSIKAMAINVVVDSTKVEDVKSVQKILVGDLGDKIQLNAAGDPLPNQPYSVNVTSVQFDQTAAKAAMADAAAANRQAQIQQIISMVPIGALILVAVMVMRQIVKFAKTQVLSPLAAGPQGASFALPAGAPSLPAGQSLDSLLAQIQGTPDLDSAPAAFPAHAAAAAYHEPDIEVEDIKNRVHIPLEQLKKMAQERPALVAQLIKSMLLEERK